MIKKTMKVRENTFRKLEDPFENGAAKKYVFYVKVDDVAEGIPMATNPRDAVLSASGSHRWLNCTPSARLELEFENTTSEAAREGTAAHALCEHKLKKFLKKRSKRPVSDYNSDEMEECTDAYAEFVMEQYEEAKKSCKDPVILIEQKLDFSCYVPEGFGTGDCIIISDDKLHIIDFKYGQGIFVEAEHNP